MHLDLGALRLAYKQMKPKDRSPSAFQILGSLPQGLLELWTAWNTCASWENDPATLLHMARLVVWNCCCKALSARMQYPYKDDNVSQVGFAWACPLLEPHRPKKMHGMFHGHFTLGIRKRASTQCLNASFGTSLLWTVLNFVCCRFLVRPQHSSLAREGKKHSWWL